VELLRSWGLHFRHIATTHNGAIEMKLHYPLFFNIPMHVVIGTRDKKQSLKKFARINPVVEQKDPFRGALCQVEMMFQVEDAVDRLLDMSADEDDNVEGDVWVSWKKKFGGTSNGDV
jgi:hypothetical protein